MYPIKLGDCLSVLVTITGGRGTGGGGGLGARPLLPPGVQELAGVGLGVPTSFLPGWLEGGSCTCLLFARVAGGGRGVLTSFLPGWLEGGSCTHLLFAWVAGGGRGVLASFLPGWLEGGVNARFLLPGCLEDGGALSLPRSLACILSRPCKVQ